MYNILSEKNELRINKRIRAQEVRVIDQDGKMIGVIPITEALRLAFEANLDLVEVSPNIDPPVCKIASYSKMKYEEQKKKNLNKKKQKIMETKEMKMSLNIGDGDFNTKIKQATKFLEKGNKVKFNFMFRGREITYTDTAQLIMYKIILSFESVGKMDEKPKMEGKRLFFIVAPLK